MKAVHINLWRDGACTAISSSIANHKAKRTLLDDLERVTSANAAKVGERVHIGGQGVEMEASTDVGKVEQRVLSKSGTTFTLILRKISTAAAREMERTPRPGGTKATGSARLQMRNRPRPALISRAMCLSNEEAPAPLTARGVPKRYPSRRTMSSQSSSG